MKIAIVIENFRIGSGGNERSTQQIAERLVAAGHDVHVLTARLDPREDPLPGGTLVLAPGGPTRSAGGLRRFVAWSADRLAGDGCDVSLSMTTAVPAAVMQPRGGTVRESMERNELLIPPGFPGVWKRLGRVLSFKKRALLQCEAAAFADPSVRRVVAISHYVADQLDRHYGMSSDRIVRVPNAAAVDHAIDAEHRRRVRDMFRAKLGLEDHETAFFFAAMNPVLKGLPPLLEAFARVRREQPAARLVVAGAKHPPSEQRAVRLGLQDAVVWAGATREMDSLYEAVDVTVLPTWYDPASKVVLESLLHRVPAISTLYNGASEWIYSPDGSARIPSPFTHVGPVSIPGQGAGRVIDRPDNLDALANAMIALCDADQRRRCAEAAEGLAERIDMDAHVRALEQVLREAAG